MSEIQSAEQSSANSFLNGHRAASNPQPSPALTRRNGISSAVAPEANMPQIGVGFGNVRSFEFTMRVARALSSSTMVPTAYRQQIPGKGKDRHALVDNPNGLPNCMVAINMADRLKADPLMVMQNLYVIEGRPSWSAQFVIALANNSSLFKTPIQFDVSDHGEIECQYEESAWVDGASVTRIHKVTVRDLRCVAWALDQQGNRVESDTVTMRMAVEEGWYGKKGSKWKTMPGQMIRYRAASFFCRIHSPHLMMGLPTSDEVYDTLEAEQTTDGTWETASEVKADIEVQQESQPTEEATIEAEVEQQQEKSEPDSEITAVKPSDDGFGDMD
jgi:hypothetical protein